MRWRKQAMAALPMHCTGERFIELLRQRMPEKVVYSNVGSWFPFGA